MQLSKETKNQKIRELYEDGKRQMELCNACRYCEGFCAVWRAIEWRREFSDNDMKYLANLCHDCRDCYYACPFTTPHEFGINPPKTFAKIREETYVKYAWPSSLAKLMGEKLTGFWIVFIVSILVFVGGAFVKNGISGTFERYTGEGSFYEIIPKGVMISVFTILGLWMVVGWLIGAIRYWRDIRSSKTDKVAWKDIITAIKYAMSLRYLDGGGAGCTYPTEKPAANRRWLHHLVGYGFLLDFASTTLAAFYDHVLHVPAPYPVFHPVVILGTVGGIMMIIGLIGLLYLKTKTDKEVDDEFSVKKGSTFSVALLFVALTGMLVLGFRETVLMGFWLSIHLASVATLFFTAPYSKFAHFVYRFLSLVNYAQEERVERETRVVQKAKQPLVVQKGIKINN